MANKLIVTAAPHITSADSTQKIMQRVCIALLPTLVASVIIFGINALIITAITVIACVVFEYLYCKLVGREVAIGDFSATTAGGLDREPTTDELQGAILGYGITNVIGAFLGCLPTATYSQNVGIVATTKVVNRVTLGISALVILVAGLFPKFSALLTTIPYAVLGGATVSVFASIAMTGMKLVMTEEMNYRNTSIVGLAAALGMGVSQASASLSSFPAWVTTIFGKSPVVIATLVAILLNVTLPREKNLYKTNK